MTTKPSNDELIRLLKEALDIIIDHNETDVGLQFRQKCWISDAARVLQTFEPRRPIPPMETLKAALSHMTTEEHAEIAEVARQIVEEADREFKRYLKRERGE